MYRIAEEYVRTMEIEKSRFITYTKKVFSEEDAKAYLQSIRKEHPNATHHCYAFVIGPNHEQQRSNDDGEPSGTAGVPMLEALRLSGIHDCIVVTVRYFGGVKLGAGGLVRAYSSSVSLCLQEAPKVVLCEMLEYTISFGYEWINKIDYLLQSKNAIILSKDYEINVTYKFALSDDSIEKQLRELSSGTLQVPAPIKTIIEKPL